MRIFTIIFLCFLNISAFASVRGNQLLFAGINSQKIEWVNQAIQSGADVNEAIEFTRQIPADFKMSLPPLAFAALKEDFAIIDVLIKAGANLNGQASLLGRDRFGNVELSYGVTSPLHMLAGRCALREKWIVGKELLI